MPRGGPPPLRAFGLVLHHDGRWTHEGVPVTHRRLREAFDRSVRFVPQAREAGAQRDPARGSLAGGERGPIGPDGVYVVQLGRFRGQIEVEEAAFFVRDFDAATGEIRLSDGTREPLDASTIRLSPRDGAGLCSVKRALFPPGLPARFRHAAWSELLASVEGPEQAPRLRIGRRSAPLPAAVARALLSAI